MSEIDRLNKLLMEHIQVNEDQNDRIQELQRFFLKYLDFSRNTGKKNAKYNS